MGAAATALAALSRLHQAPAQSRLPPERPELLSFVPVDDVLELDRGDGCTMEYTKCHRIGHFKMVKMVNVVLGIFYHSKKNNAALTILAIRMLFVIILGSIL